MKRKLIALLIAAVLLICAGCGSSGSDHGTSFNLNGGTTPVQNDEENAYVAYNGGYKLVSCGTKYKSEATVTIPEQYEGLDIVAIGNSAFSGFTAMQTVEIPGSVTEIDKRAFENCTSLNHVSIPDGVAVIRGAAFMNCTSLTDIFFGSGITDIEGECFKGCTSLEEFTVPATVTEIRGNCFEGCTALKAIYLHDDITAIHGYAFKDFVLSQSSTCCPFLHCFAQYLDGFPALK